MSRTLLSVGSLVALAMAVPMPVRAQGRCGAAKEKCAAKKVAGLLACHIAAETRGTAVDPDCLDRQGAKLTDPISGCFFKAESTRPPCLTTGDADAIESKVDAFVQNVACEIFPTDTCAPLECCGSERLTLTSDGGTLNLSNLSPFPFPPGAVVTIDVGPADAACDHVVLVPVGGFAVPTFCVPAAGFSVDIIATGCEAGGNDGLGDLWDAAAPTPTPDVTKVGD